MRRARVRNKGPILSRRIIESQARVGVQIAHSVCAICYSASLLPIIENGVMRKARMEWRSSRTGNTLYIANYSCRHRLGQLTVRIPFNKANITAHNGSALRRRCGIGQHSGEIPQ